MPSLFWKHVPKNARFYRQLNRLFGLRSLDWQTQSPLPVARRYAKAVAVNDKIYVFGGQEKESCYADPVFLTSVLATAQPVTE